ncbi:glycerate kinase [Propioniciclava soli]|uniref:Glycerate kinase n=1 Tax=Propioniciclava soli TaxID=2775081 RepID=A0ABZ3C4M0_9ACTN
MRVLICTDSIGALASADAGAALGRAFRAAAPATQVAVVPMASGGDALGAALGVLGDDAVVVRAPGDAHRDIHGDIHRDADRDAPAWEHLVHASSAGLGEALLRALADAPARVVVDLTALVTHDGGAGLLHALGARADVALDAGAAGLAGLTDVDLTPARAALGAADLIAVVPAAELGDLLLGLRGLAARRGHAAGIDPAVMLATDAALGALASALGQADAPGLGAAGGCVLALAALGAEVTSGPALCAQVAGLERTAGLADVLVTGADTLDFATRGGDVVAEVAATAGRVLRPCVAVARRVDVSARELRTFGLEVAYELGGEPDLDADGLTARAGGVASSWTW